MACRQGRRRAVGRHAGRSAWISSSSPLRTARRPAWPGDRPATAPACAAQSRQSSRRAPAARRCPRNARSTACRSGSRLERADQPLEITLLDARPSRDRRASPRSVSTPFCARSPRAARAAPRPCPDRKQPAGQRAVVEAGAAHHDRQLPFRMQIRNHRWAASRGIALRKILVGRIGDVDQVMRNAATLFEWNSCRCRSRDRPPSNRS